MQDAKISEHHLFGTFFLASTDPDARSRSVEEGVDDIDVLEIAEAIAARLEFGLDDTAADIIMLTRDEAVLTLGLVGALVEQLREGVARPT